MSQIVTRAAAALAGIALTGGLVAFASPSAQAAGATGTVVDSATVNVRTAPSTGAASNGSVRKGQTLNLVCKFYGTSVRGNDIWYKLGDNRWVSARYVKNHGSVGYCQGSSTELEPLSDVWVRRGPTTSDAKVKMWKKGEVRFGYCSVRGRSVDGNSTWYVASEGDRDDIRGWVSARYVKAYGTVPAC